MTLPATYATGTITVAANGTTVTGTGTNWLAGGIRAGDRFAIKGLSVSIASVNSVTSITLAEPWAGGALSGSPYEIRYTPDATRVLAASRAALERFEGADLRKANFSAIRAPLPSDDETQGYGVGSRWLWQGQEWVRDADGWLPVNLSNFQLRVAAQEATIPAPAQSIEVEGLKYRRDAAGTALVTGDGAKWSPEGDVTPDHWGRATDMTASIQSAITWAESSGRNRVDLLNREYFVSAPIKIRAIGFHLVGKGRGAGFNSSGTLHKKAPSRITWTGPIPSVDPYMVIINPEGAPTSGPWAGGVTVDGFGLYGGGSGISGICQRGRSPNCVTRNMEIHGVHHGVVCENSANVWRPIFQDVGVFEYTGWAFYLQGGQHNAQFLNCQSNFSTLVTPTGWLQADNATNVCVMGCDIEPGYASVFIWFKNISGFTITGNYFEARSTDTFHFIRLGDNASGRRSAGGIISGNIFFGGSNAREAIQLQNATESITVEGNRFANMVGSVINNTINGGGHNNAYGRNAVNDTPQIFLSGNKDGWNPETFSRLGADIASVSAITTAVSATHVARDRHARKMVRGVVRWQGQDGAATNVSATIVLQKNISGTWTTVETLYSSFFSQGGTKGDVRQSDVVEWVDDTGETQSQYRVRLEPGANDTATIYAGTSLHVREMD